MTEQFQDPQLDAALRTLREHTAPLATPRAVEDALLAAFAQQHPLKKSHWFANLSMPRWGAGMGLASLAGAVLTAMLVLAMPSHQPALAPVHASIDDGGDFVALASAEHIALEPAPRLVETDIARTALAALGMPLSPDNAGDVVRAQFLVGADGRPLALRLLPVTSHPQPDRG
jgi:hypothetical protein